MKFITTRVVATWRAIGSLFFQTLLLLDQGCNVLVLGAQAVFMAVLTGGEQSTCFADETLSAHAWRARVAGKPWALVLCPVVDLMFAWQKPLPEVDAAAGKVVTKHCERAFWKKRLRMGLPAEYRSNTPT